MTYVVEARDVGRADWLREASAARSEGYVFFDLLTAVDLEAVGFEVVLRLWDPLRRKGIVLRTRCPREDPQVPTLTTLWKGAAWHERATAELFGIVFEGHATTPLLLPATFEGHPLRKDFVLAARVAKRWPGAKEPGESDADLTAQGTAPGTAPSRRRPTPPGVPVGWEKP